MFARVEAFHTEPSEMDDVITEQHHATGRVRTMNGNMGGYVLVDRDNCRVLGVTFWQNEDDLRKNWIEDKRWEPTMDEGKREELYRYWKKAVTKSFDWSE